MADEIDTMFEDAVNALRENDPARAKDILTRLLKADQTNATYWVWMSAAVDTPKERIYCLETALKLDPENATAKRGLILHGALPPDENVQPFPLNRPRAWEEKLLLARSTSGAWNLPLEGAVSTHILKPEPRQYRGLAVAEAYCLAAAAAVTPTAEAELLNAEGHRPTLVVTRFDRTLDGSGTPVRIHQEDGCQILGLPPDRKYNEQANPGSPSHAEIASVLLARAQDPTVELGRFLQQLSANIALGNHDAHAKNYSIQHRNGAISLTPLYDVVPTKPFIPTDRRAAMFVGGKIVFDEITRGHLLAEARSWGMPDRAARETITDVFDRLGPGLERADSLFPQIDPETRAIVRRQYETLRNSPW